MSPIKNQMVNDKVTGQEKLMHCFELCHLSFNKMKKVHYSHCHFHGCFPGKPWLVVFPLLFFIHFF